MILDRIEQTPFGLFAFSALSYLTLLLLMRATGYQTVGQLSTLGVIVRITIGTAVAQALLSPSVPVYGGIIVAATFVLMEIGLARLALYSPWLRGMLAGRPVLLMDQGKVLEGNLHKHSIHVDQLAQLLRPLQAFHLGDVETAVLEPNGNISVQFKAEKAPLQPGQLGLPVPPSAGLPRIVINDGTVRPEQLYALGFNETWLMQELAKRGHTNLQQIVLAQADPSGRLYVDTINDFRPMQAPQDKLQLLAGLQKLQADLATYSTETDDEAVRAMFHADAARVSALLDKVGPYLQP